jgi:hypothetical protein
MIPPERVRYAKRIVVVSGKCHGPAKQVRGRAGENENIPGNFHAVATKVDTAWLDEVRCEWKKKQNKRRECTWEPNSHLPGQPRPAKSSGECPLHGSYFSASTVICPRLRGRRNNIERNRASETITLGGRRLVLPLRRPPVLQQPTRPNHLRSEL